MREWRGRERGRKGGREEGRDWGKINRKEMETIVEKGKEGKKKEVERKEDLFDVIADSVAVTV